MKTEEITTDFRKQNNEYGKSVLEGKYVDDVQCYKYLGVMMDDKLCASGNVKLPYKTAIQRVNFVRILLT